MKAINLQNIPSDFRHSQDIHTALAWNAVKKILTQKGKEKIFSEIKSVRISDTYIIISTGRPLINNEIRMYSEEILEKFHESMRSFGWGMRKGIRLQ